MAYNPKGIYLSNVKSDIQAQLDALSTSVISVSGSAQYVVGTAWTFGSDGISGTPISVNTNQYTSINVSLMGNAIINTPVNMVNGQSINIMFTQVTSPYKWSTSFSSDYNFPPGLVTIPTSGQQVATIFSILKMRDSYFATNISGFTVPGSSSGAYVSTIQPSASFSAAYPLVIENLSPTYYDINVNNTINWTGLTTNSTGGKTLSWNKSYTLGTTGTYPTYPNKVTTAFTLSYGSNGFTQPVSGSMIYSFFYNDSTVWTLAYGGYINPTVVNGSGIINPKGNPMSFQSSISNGAYMGNTFPVGLHQIVGGSPTTPTPSSIPYIYF